jgi:hypothetical protein
MVMSVTVLKSYVAFLAQLVMKPLLKGLKPGLKVWMVSQVLHQLL